MLPDRTDLFDVQSLLDDGQRAVRASVARFVDSAVLPIIADAFDAGRFPVELVAEQKKLLELACLSQHAHERENTQLREQLVQSAQALQQVVQRLEHGGERLAADALRGIDAGCRQVLKDSAVEQVQRCSEEALQRLQRVVQAADDQARQLSRAQASRAWAALACMATGAVLLVGGTGLWVSHYQKQARHYQTQVDIGRRISQADVVQCGEGLCANVDLKGRRVGDRRQYLPVKAR